MFMTGECPATFKVYVGRQTKILCYQHGACFVYRAVGVPTEAVWGLWSVEQRNVVAVQGLGDPLD